MTTKSNELGQSVSNDSHCDLDRRRILLSGSALVAAATALGANAQAQQPAPAPQLPRRPGAARTSW